MNLPPDRPPWWLWPNLLALDAPGVAVLWQRFLAAAYGLALPAAPSVSLGLVVWGVYLLDRALDARPGRPPAPTDRHRFASRHRPAVAATGGLALAGGAAVAVAGLPAASLVDGLVVGLALAAYLAAVHLSTGGLGGAKELAVGLVFAAGVGVPLAARAPDRAADWGPAVLALAAVCWLNCRLIDRWENGRPAGAAEAVAGLGAVAGVLWCGTPAVGGTIAGAVVLLAALHRVRRQLGGRLLRVGADAALLTPLAAWRWA